MTETTTPAISPAPPRAIAERAATKRLLNAFLRETGGDPPADPGLRVPLPASGCALLGTIRHRSVLGHHDYGDEFCVQHDDSDTARPVGHDELVTLLLTEVAALAARTAGEPSDGPARTAELAAQIDNSVARTTRYLQCERPPRPPATDPRALTRHTEQSLLFGHPFHPTPKSAEGFGPDDLAAYAPELRASFRLHYLAVAPELLVEDRVAPDPWVAPEVEQQARRLLGADRPAHALLPMHPWQANHLRRADAFAALVAEGAMVPLGPLGPAVYPTSSVRTVCDPAFATAWKLPLHVRITNFVRNNPPEHGRRAADAGRVVAAVRGGWDHDAFAVLLETGYRTVDVPALAADLTVLYRENPFATRPEAPQVLAGLLEDGTDGAEPALIGYVRQATRRRDGLLPAADTGRWLCRYLEISLLPLLAVFCADGVSLEAHVQNSLLHLQDGWPARFYVRDMEGTSVSRRRVAAGVVAADSPVLVDDDEAWLRLRYYVLTNHLGHLVHVLGRHAEGGEAGLWQVVRDMVRSAPPGRYRSELLSSPVLPAKANLISRFAGRGERPLYVDVPNPIREVNA
ncbi:IucA/IucC family protein [Pseudonocardia nigra]|uniref:IucA/IucC family protein n=1 Tax=Pseudonocardia nigra TaxID=1921578 RepID=UPI001C5FAD5C|nr:IucA/IucC family protein [Pseudonocardia nigra]